MTWRRRTPRCAGDAGAAAVMLVLLAPVFFAVAGFVLDGGRAIAARQGAADLAEQAARAGVNQLDLDRIRAGGGDAIDISAAQRAACRYVQVAAPAATCAASVTADQVRVTVRTHSPTVLLGLIGIDAFHTGGSATARAVTGIATPDGSP